MVPLSADARAKAQAFTRSPPPGSITAALFLKEFVSDTAWAHLDIAGPVWNEKAGGATGFGVRTLAAYAEAQASK